MNMDTQKVKVWNIEKNTTTKVLPIPCQTQIVIDEDNNTFLRVAVILVMKDHTIGDQDKTYPIRRLALELCGVPRPLTEYFEVIQHLFQFELIRSNKPNQLLPLDEAQAEMHGRHHQLMSSLSPQILFNCKSLHTLREQVAGFYQSNRRIGREAPSSKLIHQMMRLGLAGTPENKLIAVVDDNFGLEMWNIVAQAFIPCHFYDVDQMSFAYVLREIQDVTQPNSLRFLFLSLNETITPRQFFKLVSLDPDSGTRLIIQDSPFVNRLLRLTKTTDKVLKSPKAGQQQGVLQSWRNLRRMPVAQLIEHNTVPNDYSEHLRSSMYEFREEIKAAFRAAWAQTKQAMQWHSIHEQYPFLILMSPDFDHMKLIFEKVYKFCILDASSPKITDLDDEVTRLAQNRLQTMKGSKTVVISSGHLIGKEDKLHYWNLLSSAGMRLVILQSGLQGDDLDFLATTPLGNNAVATTDSNAAIVTPRVVEAQLSYTALKEYFGTMADDQVAAVAFFVYRALRVAFGSVVSVHGWAKYAPDIYKHLIDQSEEQQTSAILLGEMAAELSAMTQSSISAGAIQDFVTLLTTHARKYVVEGNPVQYGNVNTMVEVTVSYLAYVAAKVVEASDNQSKETNRLCSDYTFEIVSRLDPAYELLNQKNRVARFLEGLRRLKILPDNTTFNFPLNTSETSSPYLLSIFDSSRPHSESGYLAFPESGVEQTVLRQQLCSNFLDFPRFSSDPNFPYNAETLLLIIACAQEPLRILSCVPPLSLFELLASQPQEFNHKGKK